MLMYQSGNTQSGIPIHESQAAWQHPRNLYKLGTIVKQPPGSTVRYSSNSERILSVHERNTNHTFAWRTDICQIGQKTWSGQIVQIAKQSGNPKYADENQIAFSQMEAYFQILSCLFWDFSVF